MVSSQGECEKAASGNGSTHHVPHRVLHVVRKAEAKIKCAKFYYNRTGTTSQCSRKTRTLFDLAGCIYMTWIMMDDVLRVAV